MKPILYILIAIIVISCGSDANVKNETIPALLPPYPSKTLTQEMLDSGKVTFYKSCFICHENTVGEVTMLTNKARQDEHDVKYFENLLHHVRDGYTRNYGTMPPNGACMECSEDDLRNAIYFMLKYSGF